MVDIILLVIIGLFAAIGFKKGFTKTLMNALTTVLSLVFGTILCRPVATVLYNSPIGELLKNFANNALIEHNAADTIGTYVTDITAEYVAMLICSVISFLLITIVLKVLICIVVDAVKIVSRLPVIREANAILGLALGAVSGAVICYALLGVVRTLYVGGIIVDGNFISNIESSVICSVFYFDNAIANTLMAILY